MLPALVVEAPLLDEYGHPAKLEDVSLSDERSALQHLSLVLRRTAAPRVFLNFTQSVIADDEAALLRKILQLLRDEVVAPLDLLREVEI